MSDTVERRLVELLGHPRVSPFGNPIPGLAELGDDETEVGEWHALSQELTPTGRAVVLLRIAEQVQGDAALMSLLDTAGIRPGTTVTASTAPGGVTVTHDGARVHLPSWAADLIVVEAARP